MATQSPSGRARHPASVAVAPLISPSRVKVSAEKPDGGRRAPPSGRPAQLARVSANDRDSSHASAAFAEGGPGRRGTGTAHLCGKKEYDMAMRRHCVESGGSSTSLPPALGRPYDFKGPMHTGFDGKPTMPFA